jgi:hypothetical protein
MKTFVAFLLALTLGIGGVAFAGTAKTSHGCSSCQYSEGK